MKFLIVDAFTKTTFGGNPAGVVILPQNQDFPDYDTMLKTAAELRYSETAFIKPMGSNEFNIRYFTPASEVDLCGHATIGSFCSLLNEGLIESEKSYVNHTLSGDLNIEVADDFVMMDMATPQEIDTISDEANQKELYDIMGAKFSHELHKPKLISTGLPDIMMEVATREDLESLEPDMKALSALSARYKVTGVHAFTLDSDDGVTAHCRNFAPLYDIDEEAATGTSNGALTYYLYLNKVISGNTECKIIQGEKMKRPSEILTKITTSEGTSKVQVGGSAVILATGQINI